MEFEEFFTNGTMTEAFKEGVAGGFVGTLIAIGIFVAVLFFIALYIYSSYTWMIIARKLKYKKEWLAWIPIANLAMILQLGRFHWAWVFSIIIPPVLVVLIIISTWRIFEARNYPGWFSLSMILPKIGGILYLVAIGFVAFKEKGRSATRAPTRKKSKRRKR